MARLSERVGEPQQGRRTQAVLDLKAVYDMVQREMLMRLVHGRLSFNVAAMVSHSLQPSTFYASQENCHAKGAARRGVPQGSPISAALFNILMDTLAEKITTLELNDGKHAELRLAMFADDVILLARTRNEVQRMLRVCEGLAREYDMIWSVTKCVVLDGRRSQGPQLMLCGHQLQEVQSTEYLGY